MNNRWLGAGLVLGLGCLLFVATLRCEAQNLVPNPSFELLTDTCPCGLGLIGTAKPLYWERWNQSPDYFNACVALPCIIDSLIDVPQNGFGFQYALDGDAYVGMFAYDGNESFREYVGCQLLSPLQVGQTYVLSFFVNAVGGSYFWTRWACNNMGMLFTMQPNIWTDADQPAFELRNYAHLRSMAVISDTATWTLVSGTFQADSAYQYLVIGNFFSDALTDTMHLVPGGSLGAYCFVDGVCVKQAGQVCAFTSGIAEVAAVDPYAWPSPTNDQLHVRTFAGTEWLLFDATGRLVQTGVSATELLSIPVHDRAMGEYVLRLEGATRRHVRFVVIR